MHARRHGKTESVCGKARRPIAPEKYGLGGAGVSHRRRPMHGRWTPHRFNKRATTNERTTSHFTGPLRLTAEAFHYALRQVALRQDRGKLPDRACAPHCPPPHTCMTINRHGKCPHVARANTSSARCHTRPASRTYMRRAPPPRAIPATIPCVLSWAAGSPGEPQQASDARRTNAAFHFRANQTDHDDPG
jgi:hypothetical protein